MKFSEQHFKMLKDSIASLEIDYPETRKRYNEKGLSEQRFYWDIFWASSFHKNNDFREADYLDTHIETAIKRAVKELEHQ